MAYIVIGVFFLLISFVIFIVYLFARRNEIVFTENTFYTTGIVRDREVFSAGSMDERYVKVVDRNGEERIILSQPFRAINGYIEPGTSVRVALAERKVFGVSAYTLKIIDENYVKSTSVKLSTILLGISVLFLTLAVSMFVTYALQ